MVVFTFILAVVALLFYNISLTAEAAFFLLCIAGVAALVEGITPLGLDNLSVPFVTAILYWLVMIP